MAEHHVTVFRVFPFQAGQKIRIADGPRCGDWEVVDVTQRKVRLRCPVSFREVEWDRFCYFAGEQAMEWPKRD